MHTASLRILALFALPAALVAQTLPQATDVFIDGGGEGTFSINVADGSFPVRLIGPKGMLEDLHSAPGTGLRGGKLDRAIDLNHKTARIELDGRKAPMLLVNSAGFTLAGWYKSTTLLDDYAFVFSNRKDNSGITFNHAPDGRAILEVHGSGDVMQNRAESTVPVFINDGQWRFFAVVFNKGAANFYVGTANGITVNAGGGAVTPTTTGAEPLAWAQWGNQPNNPREIRQFRALVDNLWVIDRALTPTEIEALRKQDLGISE